MIFFSLLSGVTEIELDVSKKAKPGKNNNKAPSECQGIY